MQHTAAGGSRFALSKLRGTYEEGSGEHEAGGIRRRVGESKSGLRHGRRNRCHQSHCACVLAPCSITNGTCRQGSKVHSISTGSAVKETSSFSGAACSIASTVALVIWAGARGSPTSRRMTAQASRPIQAKPFTHHNQVGRLNNRVGSSRRGYKNTIKKRATRSRSSAWARTSCARSIVRRRWRRPGQSERLKTSSHNRDLP